jgi:hypothetical protein
VPRCDSAGRPLISDSESFRQKKVDRSLMAVNPNKFVFGIVFLDVSPWRPQIVIRLVEVAHGI